MTESISQNERMHWLQSRRLWIVVLCGLSVVISYADRSNMAIGIIPMSVEFAWSKVEEGFILSTFFYGYMATQVLGGYLADRYGGKNILMAGCFLWTIFTFLTPCAAHLGIETLAITRILMGAGEGVGFPAIHSLIARWIPPSEQSSAVAFVTACSYLGAVLAMIIAAPLAAMPGGWPWIYYLFTIFGCLWMLPWYLCGYNSPEDCPYMSPIELAKISELRKLDSRSGSCSLEAQQNETAQCQDPESDHPFSLSEENLVHRSNQGTSTIPRPVSPQETQFLIKNGPPRSQDSVSDISTSKQTPWVKILTTKEVWAILINHFCNSWGFYVLLNWLPSYYFEVFGVNIQDLGYFSVLPYIVQGSVGMLSGRIADMAIGKYGMSITTVRKLAQSIGMLGTAMFMMLAAFTAHNVYLGVIYISLGLGINALTLIGLSVSQLDIAPKYAGVIFGLGNTVATLTGIIGVQVTGYMIDEKQWSAVFGLASFLYVLGTFFWIAWAGGDQVVIE